MTDLILLALDESPTLNLLSRAIHAVGYSTAVAHDRVGVSKVIQESQPALLLLGSSLNGEKGTLVAQDVLMQHPTIPIIFLATESSTEVMREALRIGISAYLEPPLKTDEIIDAIKSSLARAKRTGDWLRQEVKHSTASLEKRIDELEVLLAIGRDITSNLEIDSVLNNVVSAAVQLTKAEEGSLLLLDKETNELYMRAGHNFEEGFKDTFRLPLQDTLAGKVLETGEPVTFNKDSLHKIKTAYLIQALIYVPLKIKDRIIGVLGVDNRTYQLPFGKRDTLLLSILADYAAVAIENANLYQSSDTERSKFEAVLSNMDDALLILNHQERIELINDVMSSALNVNAEDVHDKVITEVIKQNDILDLLRRKDETSLRYHEVNLEDERVFSAQYTPSEGVGAVITMQDIPYLK